jgi:hypothetical protein
MDDEVPGQPPASKPSWVPSWVMLGFVLGALFVLALPRRAPPPAPEPAPDREPAQKAAPLAAPRMLTIEAVFAEWGKYAVWSNDLTQVALWNTDANAFTDCFEVMRFGGNNYFRTIPSLTRPLLKHGIMADSPLLFTETEEQQKEWLKAVDEDNWRALKDSMPGGKAPKAP